MNRRFSRIKPATFLALSLMLAVSGFAGINNPAQAATPKKATINKTKQAPSGSQSNGGTKHNLPETAASKPVLDENAKKAIQEAAQKLDPETKANLNKLSEAMHLQDRAIYNELRDDDESAFSSIGMLWQAAVEHNNTIRFAIEKLSRQDATGKPVAGDSFSTKMVQSLVHLGGVAGTMWTGTPAGMIGSNMVQDLMRGNPEESALSRVTDADMVILAKEVENLQAKLIEVYYNYRNSKERLALAKEASSTIGHYYDHAESLKDANSLALQPLVQSMYDNAKQDEQNALQGYNSARNELGLLVGTDALAALDQSNSPKSNSGKSATPISNN